MKGKVRWISAETEWVWSSSARTHVCGKMWREGGQERREASARPEGETDSKEGPPTTALSFSCPPRWSRWQQGHAWWPGCGAEGRVSVCYLGPGLCWAWGAKQPWGQETTSEWV